MSWVFQVVSRLKQARGVTGIGSVIVLSLATIVSAWCAYQAARWGGIFLPMWDMAQNVG